MIQPLYVMNNNLHKSVVHINNDPPTAPALT
jgi:hypothetical protein